MSKMGEGPQIVIYDASMVAHAGLRDFVTDVADELSIPYQFEAIPMGGTDSGSIHLTGNGIRHYPLPLQHATFILIPRCYIAMILKMQ